MSLRFLTAALGVVAVVTACAGPGATVRPTTTAGPTTPPTAAPTATAAAGPAELVIGFVPSVEAEQLVEDIQPVADALEEALGIPVEGFVSNDYAGLVTAMQTGQAHIGAFAPFPMVQAVDEAGAEVILQSERFGSGTYHTQFFTTDSETYCDDEPAENERISSDVSFTLLNCNSTARANEESPEGPLADTKLAGVPAGANVAFVEQSSSSGYIFPATVFANQGIDPETDINPIFAGQHAASVIAVCEGQADVGVSFDDARPEAAEISDCDVEGTVVVFAYGPEIPNDGIVVAGDLPDELKAQIKQALLDYSTSEEGQTVLDEIYNITALTEPNLESLQIVRDAVEQLELD